MEHLKDMVTAGQIRAARALLDWSQRDLVEKSKLSLTTIRRMEDSAIGPGRSSSDNLETVQGALEAGGIVFLDPGAEGGPGIRLAR